MATTEEDDLAPEDVPEGVIAQTRDYTYRVIAEARATAYGDQRRTLWPVALIALTGVALALGGALWLVVGVVSLALLAVWVGARA